MDRRGRLIGVSLTLIGFLCSSAQAHVDALHVGLEHQADHEAEGVSHPFSATEESHSHLHTVTVHAGGSHSGLHDVSHGEAPEHEHVLAPTTGLQPRPDQPAAAALSADTLDVAEDLRIALRPSMSAASADGPASRAAPLSRRTVVLQV